MITDFDYNELPASYTLCLHEGCPRAAQCLRCALGLGVPAEHTFIQIEHQKSKIATNNVTH